MTHRFDSAWSRYVTYPRSLRHRTSAVFHILDHGYSQLIRHLDPDRTVVTCHDLIPLLAGEGLVPIKVPSTVVRTFRARIALMARARRVVAITETTKATLERYTAVPSERISVIPYGVNSNFRVLTGAKARLADPRLRAARIVLQVATAVRYKNTSVLLEAFAQVRARLGDVMLVRIGAPFFPDDVELAAQARPPGRHPFCRQDRRRPAARRVVQRRGRPALPLDMGGVRLAAARSDGVRHAGRRLDDSGNRRSGRRRGRPRCAPGRAGHRTRRRTGADRRGPCRHAPPKGTRPRGAVHMARGGGAHGSSVRSRGDVSHSANPSRRPGHFSEVRRPDEHPRPAARPHPARRRHHARHDGQRPGWTARRAAERARGSRRRAAGVPPRLARRQPLRLRAIAGDDAEENDPELRPGAHPLALQLRLRGGRARGRRRRRPVRRPAARQPGSAHAEEERHG